MKTRLLLVFATLLFYLPDLWTQTAPGAGELVAAIPIFSADHLRVTELAGNIPANTGADYYQIQYTTPDVAGVLDTASGLLIVPQRGDIGMSMAVYQRGTPESGATAASNLTATDAVFFGSALAGQGIITLSPDYLGMGASRGFHPYLDKETEASVAIDMLYAVEAFLAQVNIGWNGQLFVTGYSQGGHAAMATHQELQANYQDDWPVTRSAPMSGAYDLPLIESFLLDANAEFSSLSLAPFVIIGLQESQGDIYTSLDEVFKEPYVGICSQFLSADWETGVVDINSIGGQLANAMFPIEGGLYPARMIQDDYRQAMEADENHPLRVALRENRPLDWSPQAPIILPYCEEDNVTDPEHALRADSILSATGAEVTAINGGPNLDHIQCAGPSLFITLDFFNAVRTDRGQIVPGAVVHEDSLRTYVVYLPPAYDGTEEVPVVFKWKAIWTNATGKKIKPSDSLFNPDYSWVLRYDGCRACVRAGGRHAQAGIPS